MKTQKESQIAGRLKSIGRWLAEWKIDALLVTNPVDLYYLTGISFSEGVLIVFKSGGVLIVDGRYFEMASQLAHVKVELFDESILRKLFTKKTALGFDALSLAYRQYADLAKSLNNVKLVPIDAPVQQIRAIKDSDEIKQIKKACALCVEGFEFIVKRLKKGITEIELAKTLQMFWLEKGADGVAFEPIIAFKQASSMPHYRAGSQKISGNGPLLIDIGVQLDHYTSDMTRMVHIGRPKDDFLEVFEIVKGAHEKARLTLLPKESTQEVDRAARDFIKNRGYEKEFSHSLGHGLGLDVHELPRLRKRPPATLLEGQMVVTIEPGVYLPGKFGVRLENTYVVKKKAAQNLISLPLDLIQLPSL